MAESCPAILLVFKNNPSLYGPPPVARTAEDIDFEEFFRRLGGRLRAVRLERGWAQEDLIEYGFSARHYQQIEAGRALTLKTLARLCLAFHVKLANLVRSLERHLRRPHDWPRAPRNASRRRRRGH